MCRSFLVFFFSWIKDSTFTDRKLAIRIRCHDLTNFTDSKEKQNNETKLLYYMKVVRRKFDSQTVRKVYKYL